MIELLPVDLSNPEHCAFILKVGKESAPLVYGDYCKDPILMVSHIEANLSQDIPAHFIVLDDGVMTGYIGAIVDVHKNAYLEGAMLKRYRSFYRVREALLDYIIMQFDSGSVQKFKAQIPVFNLQAELLCRSLGFCKEGIANGDAIYNGQRVNVLQLALFPHMVKQNASRVIMKKVLERKKRGK